MADDWRVEYFTGRREFLEFWIVYGRARTQKMVRYHLVEWFEEMWLLGVSGDCSFGEFLLTVTATKAWSNRVQLIPNLEL